MYIDAQATFSKEQALTADAPSTNSIDLGFDGNVGIGEPMSIVITFDADAGSAGSVELKADNVDTFASEVTIATRVIDPALVAGDKIVLSVPADTSAKRFIRLSYVGGFPTTVTAFLIPTSMIDNYVSYPKGYTIS